MANNKKKSPAKKMSKSGMKKTKGGSFSWAASFSAPTQKEFLTGPTSINQFGGGGGQG